MPNPPPKESEDPIWALLSRSAKPQIGCGFAETVIGRVQGIVQDSPPYPSIRQLFASAPAGWQAAAAAIIVISASLGLVGLLSDPDPARLVATVNTDLSIAIAEWDTREESPASLSPLDDILATDELDRMLQIEEAESLENEDLLLLLFPDWELL